ncbi:uncharacterized protein LOC128878289 [Hylaeus volcanicus]|uniref:uncharacterized protein LOC128878289 n=1 Tax=Hylaeus volcanicus TaxID=313075 RepID=UPI0023B838DF|nr:uncharacterized protein LOC128878289 [Hylaeus volcanicus]
MSHVPSFAKMLGEDGSKFITIILFLTFFCHRTSSECTQLSPCSCMFSNGQGYNLTELGNSGPLIALQNINQSLTLEVHFHPCTNIPLSNVTDECQKGASLCAKWGNKTVNLGTVEETKIIVSPDNLKEPVLSIAHNKYTTIISLICCHTCSTQFTINSVNNDKDYHMLLVSPFSCKVQLSTKGLSTGSMLVIFFFVFTGMYFIGGAIALKLLRGATGLEMIPNHEFWVELPSLIRDGIVFTFNCCRADSYERI